MKKRESNQKGMAFVLALVAVLIISVLLGGMMLLSVSHLALSNTNSDYANAMNLAEAGVNWAFWMVTHKDDPATAKPQEWLQADWDLISINNWSSNKPIINDTAINRFFRARISGSEDGTTTWTPPNEAWIFSEGTVNGVRRTVRVKVIKGTALSGPEGPYALFGINNLDINGNLTVQGASGTNNPAELDANGSYYFDGNFYYCGVGGDPLPSGGVDQSQVSGTIQPTPLAEAFRTINELANQRALEAYGATTTQGIEFFQTHNNNNNIYDSAGKKVKINAGQPRLDSNVWKDTSGTIILEPGDYYFVGMDLPGSNTLRVNATPGVAGAVNIWLGPEAGGGGVDRINGQTDIASENILAFHIYEGSKRTLWLEGTQDLKGCIYAYNGPDKFDNYYGEIKLTGDALINGSVIGYNIEKAQGNAQIILPSLGGGNPPPGGHFLFYALVPDWKELNPL